MKKILTGALELIMCCVMAVPVFADTTITPGQDGNPTSSTGTTDVSFTVAPTYAVSIPEDVSVTFNDTETSWGSIEVTQAQIEPNMQIEVSLTAGNTLINQADNTQTLPYTVNSEDGVFTSGTYLAAGDKTDLTISITREDWNQAAAGAYEDTVTFTVSYEVTN